MNYLITFIVIATMVYNPITIIGFIALGVVYMANYDIIVCCANSIQSMIKA